MAGRQSLSMVRKLEAVQAGLLRGRKQWQIADDLIRQGLISATATRSCQLSQVSQAVKKLRESGVPTTSPSWDADESLGEFIARLEVLYDEAVALKDLAAAATIAGKILRAKGVDLESVHHVVLETARPDFSNITEDELRLIAKLDPRAREAVEDLPTKSEQEPN